MASAGLFASVDFQSAESMQRDLGGGFRGGGRSRQSFALGLLEMIVERKLSLLEKEAGILILPPL